MCCLLISSQILNRDKNLTCFFFMCSRNQVFSQKAIQPACFQLNSLMDKCHMWPPCMLLPCALFTQCFTVWQHRESPCSHPYTEEILQGHCHSWWHGQWFITCMSSYLTVRLCEAGSRGYESFLYIWKAHCPGAQSLKIFKKPEMNTC